LSSNNTNLSSSNSKIIKKSFNPNNIRLEEEKARKRGKVFNWETAKYGKIWYDEDIHNLRSVETEFPAIAFNDEVSSETLYCEPTVSSLNNEIDFRISFDDFDDEDYTVIFEKNSFSYKIISTNDLKTDSENDNEKAMPSLPSYEPAISCLDDLDFFKDFENEFPAIVYNDAQISKSDLLTEPILSPQRIDEFDLNGETSLSEYDEEEQNILYFNDLFPFNIIHPDDLKLEKDNDDNDINIIQSSEDMALPPPDQRHQFLRYEGLQYTNGDIVDFNARLLGYIGRRCTGCRFGEAGRSWSSLVLLDTMGLRAQEQIPRQGDLRDRLAWISSTGDFFGTTPSYTAIRDPILRMGGHRMDVGWINVPYLLARYLRLFSAGRKSGALISRVRLQICMEIDDTWDWVAQGPERQPDDAAGAHKAAEDAPAVDDDMLRVVPPPPRTQGPRERNIDDSGGEFTNMEILKVLES
ncbi:hypothetical protein Tco_0882195, partial [Tanacetum coccineum]